MNPKGVTMRECRDSADHPISLPIIVTLDTTGSMAEVPKIIQGSLNKLMGTFLDDKASGKRYLGEAYPSIMISAVDDYFAQIHGYPHGEGALQVGQFESGLEIDDNLGKLWFTRNGGGNEGESYDLALYFAAKHTAHDHWDKRGRKGYHFIIGDEPWFKTLSATAIGEVIGDPIQADLDLKSVVAELKSRYHVYFILPKMTQGWSDSRVSACWPELLGEEHFIRLENPSEICTLIASLVAINEGTVTVDDLCADGVCDPSMAKALVLLASAAVAAHALDNLPSIGGKAGGVSRL